MIEAKRIPCEWKEEYSVNGVTFDSYHEAESYQNLLNNPNILTKLEFVSHKGEKLVANDFLRAKDIPEFCYLKVKEDLPFAIYITSFLYFVNNNQKLWTFNSEINNKLPSKKGIYYNNYSNAYNGGYGRNGFEKIATLEELEIKKKEIENKIERTKKIYNYF